jgi:hypothetical protein
MTGFSHYDTASQGGGDGFEVERNILSLLVQELY